MATIIEILFVLSWLLIIALHIGIRRYANHLDEEPNKMGLSGFEVARKISSAIALEEPHIIKKKGNFLDHYNINRNVIKLSPKVFDGTSRYAALMAINIALETDKDRINLARRCDLSVFLVLASYIIIILGAFLNNSSVIHFGFILFIIATILELIFRDKFVEQKEMDNTLKLVKETGVINSYEELEEDLILTSAIHLIRLPYAFINYFR